MSASPRIAIVHYHLKPGGVTRVIESTLRGLGARSAPPRCVMLSSTPATEMDWAGASTYACVSGLDYSNAQSTTPHPDVLVNQLREAARSILGGPPDVWHFHNHALGKNTSLPGVITRLAEAGDALLLHMHDFAEDGRPENYRLNQAAEKSGSHLYPDAPHVHYAVLNARDHAIFRRTGIPAERLHLLSNPVENVPAPAAGSGDAAAILQTLRADQLVLYPVRAVRRKNFGEMLLWSAMAQPGTVYASTLGPTNRNYEQAYQQWQALANQLHLPVRFGIGEAHGWPFPAMMCAASSILSTSIAEGFGLAFLEPWLYGKPLWGRDLPAITADFKAHGIQLDALYTAIPIPTDWLDMAALHRRLEAGLRKLYQDYRTPLPENAVDAALAGICPAPGYVDFAGLDEPLQAEVLQQIARNPALKLTLANPLPLPDPHSITINAGKIQQECSLDHYSRKLTSIYETLANVPQTREKVSFFPPGHILRAFLKPETFRLLRT